MEKDSLAERGEFELPVPICEQSDDSIRLSFATSRRTAKALSPCSALLVRFGVAGSDRGKLPFYWIAAATSGAMSFIAHEGNVSSYTLAFRRRGHNL